MPAVEKPGRDRVLDRNRNLDLHHRGGRDEILAVKAHALTVGYRRRVAGPGTAQDFVENTLGVHERIIGQAWTVAAPGPDALWRNVRNPTNNERWRMTGVYFLAFSLAGPEGIPYRQVGHRSRLKRL